MSVDRDTWVYISVGYDERHSCYVCGKRRMTKQFFVGNVGFDVCRDHTDWWPTEGVDYEVAE